MASVEILGTLITQPGVQAAGPQLQWPLALFPSLMQTTAAGPFAFRHRNVG